MGNSTIWRAWVAVAVFLMLLAGAFLAFRPAPTPDKQPTEVEPGPGPSPSIPVPVQPLDRAELIDAANLAADAAASGKALPEELAELVGRRFVLRIPFGCGAAGSQNESSAFSWSYDPARQTLRASVTPQAWSEDTTVRELAGPLVYEAAEGFWIPRPWLRGGDCPLQTPASPAQFDQAPEKSETNPVPVDSPPATGIRETLGIAEFHLPGSPRAARRNGRPFTFSEIIDPEKFDLSQGLRIVIEGRLLAFSNTSPFACVVENSDLRPICLIRADITKVAISDASGNATLAEWKD